MRIFNPEIEITPCKKCDGTKLLRDEKKQIIFDSNEQPLKCECAIFAAYLDANIGFDYWKIEPENWQGEDSDLEQILKYFNKVDILKEEGRGFFIVGPYASGKTSLAMLLLKHIMKTTHYSCLFVPFSELVILNTQLMTGWTAPELSKALRYIKNVDFLVLDDLAKEYDNNKDNGRATLNSILRYRDMWHKPTIYTSNIALQGTETKYGGGNFSIIQGRSTIITMAGTADFRLHRKKSQERRDKK